MKLNKKGFAVSTILYSLLIIFMLLIVLIFTLFDSTNGLFSNALNNITNTSEEQVFTPPFISNFNKVSDTSYIYTGAAPLVDISDEPSDLPENYTYTAEGVINPYIPGDYTITYNIYDENNQPYNAEPIVITITIPEPTISSVSDVSPGTLSGTGTSVDPYLIESIEDLVAFSQSVTGGNTYSTKYINLVRDLDFNSDSSYINPNTTDYGDINGINGTEALKTELTTGAGFLPIGSSTKVFTGLFNGNFKTIKNLFINRPATNYIGLFGYLDTTSPKIRNLTLKSPNVTGYSYTGAIVGYTRGEVLNSSVIDGTVVGYDSSALAVGYTQSNIMGVIVSGNLTGHTNVGGILGNNDSSGRVLRGAHLGGTITCTSVCYRIYGRSGVSAVGFNGASYTTFADKDITINGSTVATPTYSIGASGGEISDFSEINNINLLNMVYDTYIGGDNDSDGYYFDYVSEDSNVIVLKSTATNPIDFDLTGSGTSGSPYLISNYSELRQATSKLGSLYYYKLTQDIDLAGKNFYMFGTFGQDFKGVFSGDTHKLSNILIDAPIASVVGFTGKNDYTIANIVFENMTVNGLSYVGSVTGFNANTITNIRVENANVTAEFTHAGGVAGYQKANIISTIASGNVEGTQYVGGIAGYVNGGTTRSVFKDGNILSTTASADSGRVFGANSSGTLNNYGFKSDTKVKVNNVVVTSALSTSKHGLDASAADLIDPALTIYANAGFNTSIESTYIWYLDNGEVKLRRGTSM
ncbi:MAG TPA: hypothetical protein PKY25_03220 [Bacilli bacterium]|nr:hypothetical protein [Bacilli bacterium]